MPDYKALYEQLFDVVTDAIIKLKQAQIDTVDSLLEEKSKEKSEKISAQIKADFGKKSKKD